MKLWVLWDRLYRMLENQEDSSSIPIVPLPQLGIIVLKKLFIEMTQEVSKITSKEKFSEK